MAFSPISQQDFSGGVNAVASPFIIGPKQVAHATNMILDEHGSLRTIDGTHIVSTAPSTEWGCAVQCPLTWTPIGGPIQRLVITRPPVGQSKLWDRSTTPWTLLGTFSSNPIVPSFAALNNSLMFADGYNVPFYYLNGVWLPAYSFGGAPVLVGAKYLATHEGFMYAFNTAPYSGTFDSPSTLRQSDFNNPGHFDDQCAIFIDKDDGFQGMGMASYTIAESGIAPIDTLLLFKEYATYQMTGNLGDSDGGQGTAAPSSNFTLQKVKSDMGCVAPGTIKFCSGFGVIRLSHRGFALYDGTDDRLISEEIRPYLFGSDDIAGLDWNSIMYCSAAQSPNPPLYIAFCPTSGPGLTRAFIYDLIRRAWTVVDLPFPVASVTLVLETSSNAQVLLGDFPPGNQPGNLRRWLAEDPDWDGEPIIQYVRSKGAFEGGPLQPTYFRRIHWDFVADTDAVVTYTTTYSSGYVKGPYAQSAYQSIPQNILTADLDVNARNAYYDLCIVGRVRLRAHEWHIKKKQFRSTNI